MEENRTLARMLAGEVEAGVCGRCGRWTHHLESWLERRRLRLPAPVPGGHAYRHRIVEHMVCPACHGEVKAGRAVERSPAFLLSAILLVTTLLVAAVLPMAMPDIVAAFWRNGAAPYGWHAGHTEGRRDFVQGRF